MFNTEDSRKDLALDAVALGVVAFAAVKATKRGVSWTLSKLDKRVDVFTTNMMSA